MRDLHQPPSGGNEPPKTKLGSLRAIRDDHPVTEADRLLYGSTLRDIKMRIDAALGLLAPPHHNFRIEQAALHLRMVLELIVLSSLITNRAAIESVATALHRKDHKEARKLAKRANPDYWPDPSKQVELPSPAPVKFRLEPIDRPIVQEHEWGREIGRTSECLHARNPLYAPLAVAAAAVDLNALALRIVALLDHHTIVLADRDFLVIAGMQTKETGDVQVALFTRAEP